MDKCPDEVLLRELISYDVRCPECTDLVPTGNGFYHAISAACLHWSRQYEYPWAIKNSNLKDTDICLDAGGGHSVFKYALAKRCKKVIAIDLDEESFDKSAKSVSVLGIKNIEYQVCAIEDYDCEEKFDKIYCISVLEHIKEKEVRMKCIENMLRLLRDDGELFLSVDFISDGHAAFQIAECGCYIDLAGLLETLSYLGVERNRAMKLINGGTPMSYRFPSSCAISVICLKVTK